MTEPRALRLVAIKIPQLGKKERTPIFASFLWILLSGFYIGFALLDERCLGRTSQWLASAAERLGLAA